ncbi:uncharacterized protein LOC142981190 isoform X1 [Anticarsia gemmatalis]|uniref:uncharacterized protein LOC142981190 isoform X1 n=1 Tax=Anticarsia gemmatalis TaxID=129554 RepID=UPI003F76AB6A
MNNLSDQLILYSSGASLSEPSGSSDKLVVALPTTDVNLDDVKDFSNVCRICATVTELVIPIFSGEGLQNNLADKIQKHLPIKVSTTDVLPQVVCYQCSSTLLAWHELVKCCVQADQALKTKVAADARLAKGGKLIAVMAVSGPGEDQKALLELTKFLVAPAGPTPAGPLMGPAITKGIAKGGITLRPNGPPTCCMYCGVPQPNAHYNEHLVMNHWKRIFLCEECDDYIDAGEFMIHMQKHAVQYDLLNKQAIKDQQKKEKNKKANAKRSRGLIAKSKAKKIKTTAPRKSKPVKTEPDNDFSDRSDSTEGFEPIPESVFEAIDSQDESRDGDKTDGDKAGDDKTGDEPKEDGGSEREDDGDDENSSGGKRSPGKQRKARACPICSKTYRASSSFFYHMKHAHGRAKEHECDACAKKFASRAALAAHLATHAAPAHRCAACDKRFRSRASLYIHEQTHGAPKAHACATCGAAFRWRTHLARHAERHAAERAHVCATCGRGFAVRCDLLRHARTHAAGSYACRHCNVTFAQQRYLTVHVNKKHAKPPATKPPATKPAPTKPARRAK